MKPTAVPSLVTTTPDLTTLAGVFAARPSFEDLEKLGLAKLADLSKLGVTLDKKIKESSSSFKSNAKWLGKVVAAMQVQYAKAQDAGVLEKGESFNSYHERVTGGSVNNHAQACASAYNQLVITGLLAESDYDKSATDWLENSSACLKEVTKSGGKLELSNPAVAKVVDILETRDADTAAKSLRRLKGELKGTDEKSSKTGGTDGSPLAGEFGPVTVVDAIRRAFAMGLHSLLLAEVVREVHAAKAFEARNGNVEAFWNGCLDLTDAWEKSGMDTSAWEAKRCGVRLTPVTAAAPAVEIAAPVTPALEIASLELPEAEIMAFVASSYGTMSNEEQAIILPEVINFFEVKHRLPVNSQELDGWLEQVAA